MTQFEVMIVEAMHDMAREMGGMNQRVKALEERFDESPPAPPAPRPTVPVEAAK